MWWLVYYVLYSGIICFAIYWYLFKSSDYWKKLGVPHEKEIPLVRSLISMIWSSITIHEADLKRYRKYGKLYGYYEAGKPILSIADPDLLRNIMVKDFQFFPNHLELSFGDPLFDNILFATKNEDWKRIRTLMTPAFTTGRIKKMMNIILDSTMTVARSFEKAAETGKPVDAKRSFESFAMDVIASAAFATKIDSFNNPDNEFVTKARKAFGGNISWRIIMFFLMPSLMKRLGISFFSPSVSNFFKDVILKIIHERKRTGMKGNDFLQLMLDAADRSTEMDETTGDTSVEQEGEKNTEEYGYEENNDQIFKTVYKNKSMSYDEMVAQCVIFFLAGFESTSTALSLACLELALNPEIQEKLISEIDATFASNEEESEYEAIQSVKYLDNVISETLRKYPSVVRLDRLAEKDYRLGDTGIIIRKGILVTVPVYAMHHDPKFYPEPEKFDPDRFLPEAKSQRHPYTYLPFGAGPRNCLGMRFALMKIQICLAYLLSHFRIKSCPETKAPLKFLNGSGLLTPKQVLFKIEKRHDKVIAF